MLPRFSRFLLGVLAIVALVMTDPALHSATPPPRPQQPTQQQIQQYQQQMQQQQQQFLQQYQQMIQQRQQQMQQQAQRNQQAATQQQQQMARTAQQLQQQMARQVQQAQQQAKNAPKPVLKEVSVEYEFVIADEGFVRSLSQLEPELDENGKPKKLDPEEKKKLKGDTPEERRLAGYKATLEDVQQGDEVTVTIAKHRPSTRSPRKAKDPESDEEKPKAKGKEKEKDAEREEKDEKPKTKGKEKDGDGEEVKEEKKPSGYADWKPVGKLHGIVAEVDGSGSRRMTIRMTSMQWVMPQNGKNPDPQTNRISIDPGIMQSSLIVIVKRGTGAIGGGTSGGFGDAFKKGN